MCVCLKLSHLHLQVDSTSTHSTSDDTEELSTMKVDGVTPSSEGYLEGDRVLVWHGRGKTLRTYEAKILGVEESEDLREYLVHYNGWNIRLGSCFFINGWELVELWSYG